MDTRPADPAPAGFTPAYRPTPDDLDEMSTIRAVHDVLDLAHDLPMELRWGLLDYVAAVLDGNGRATSAADRAA